MSSVPGRLLLVASLFPVFVRCLTNITVDENSPLIRYSGDWTQVTGDLDAGGGHRLTMDPNAFAEITFTYASFYFMSVKWPYQVRTALRVDQGPTTILDLQDYTNVDDGTGGGTIASSIVHQSIGTRNQTHTIRVSMPQGDQYAVVDRFIFEVEDPPTVTPSGSNPPPTGSSRSGSSSSTTSPSSPTASKDASTSSQSSSINKTLAIILGVLGPIVVILLAFLIWWFCFRRKRREDESHVYATEKPPNDINNFIYSNPSLNASFNPYNPIPPVVPESISHPYSSNYAANEPPRLVPPQQPIMTVTPSIRPAAGYGNDGRGAYAALNDLGPVQVTGPYVPYVPSSDAASTPLSQPPLRPLPSTSSFASNTTPSNAGSGSAAAVLGPAALAARGVQKQQEEQNWHVSNVDPRAGGDLPPQYVDDGWHRPRDVKQKPLVTVNGEEGQAARLSMGDGYDGHRMAPVASSSGNESWKNSYSEYSTNSRSQDPRESSWDSGEPQPLKFRPII